VAILAVFRGDWFAVSFRQFHGLLRCGGSRRRGGLSGILIGGRTH
jgi:hypothetical protein